MKFELALAILMALCLTWSGYVAYFPSNQIGALADPRYYFNAVTLLIGLILAFGMGYTHPRNWMPLLNKQGLMESIDYDDALVDEVKRLYAIERAAERALAVLRQSTYIVDFPYATFNNARQATEELARVLVEDF